MPSLERLMQDRTARHVELAKETHRLMLRTVESKGLGHYRHHGIDGYVVPKSISSFIWTAYHSLGGDEIVEYDVDIIRAYLKVTRNVVSLQSTPNFRRTFVRSTWNDEPIQSEQPTPEPDAIDRRAQRLQPSEAGEDRTPAPVEVRKIKQYEKAEYVWGERPLAVLGLLERDGRISDTQGLVTSKVADLIADPKPATLSKTIGKLADRGLIRREKRGARRTNWIEITDKGLQILQQARERGYHPVLPDEPEPTVATQPEPVYVTAKAHGTDHAPSVPDTEFKAENAARVEIISKIINEVIEEEIDKRVRNLTDPVLHVRRILKREDLTPIQMLSEIESVLKE